MTSQIVGSDYTDGAQLPNYVNGRVLVAEDLATGQATLRARDQRSGQAAGAGVVRGLWVTASQTTLTVQDGLAMSAAGEPVVVAKPVTLPLTLTSATAPVTQSSFSCCTPAAADGQSTQLPSGILLLIARAACRLQGSAPVSGVVTDAAAVPPTSCAAQWQVEGVEFRAVTLPVGDLVAGVAMSAGNRRNLVAHWCFGTAALASLPVDPFGFATTWTGFDLLDPADLTTFDVPLAVFAWDGSAVTDLDNWSARRRITAPDPVPSSWSVTVSDRRIADGQARFLQFQDQAEQLVSQRLAATAVASDHFGLLPPVGFLPIENREFADMAATALHQLSVERVQVADTQTEDQVRNRLSAEWAARPFTFVGAAAPAQPAGGTTPVLVEPTLFYQNLAQIAKLSIGYGYNPSTFFGRLARVGGFIDWELAEWLLDQSWRRPPVATAGWLSTQVGSTTPLQAYVEPPITYYYVLPNVAAAGSATQALNIGPSEVGFVRSNLYVVFVANIRWAQGSDTPAMSYPTNPFAR